MTQATTLDDLVQTAVTTSEKVFTRDGELMPVWIFETADEGVVVVGTPWSNPGEKHAMAAVLRDMFAAKGVTQFVFVCEAWTVEGAKGTVDLNVAPSQHPERREVVMIHAADNRGTHIMRARRIIRDGKKKPRLGPLQDWGVSLMHGPLADLLPVERKQ